MFVDKFSIAECCGVYEEEFGEKILFATDIRDMPDDQFVKYMRGESNEWKVRINNPDEILIGELGRNHM